jgi:hypothetical protein
MNTYNEPFSLKGSAISVFVTVNKRACALLVAVDELIFWHLFFEKWQEFCLSIKRENKFKHNKDKETSHTYPNH